jgi:aminobenzoyl-glutamate utilization protein B
MTNKWMWCVFLGMYTGLWAQKTTPELQSLTKKAAEYAAISDQIWDWAEMGYQEVQSSALLAETLRKQGFKITMGVAGIPTAFVAEYGESGPTLGILGEYDALPGLSQQAIPMLAPAGGLAGHGCGHHLFGTASVAAAIEVKNFLSRTGTPGKIKFFGCPAEEGGSGKVYMVREGLFNEVDVVLHWHPASTHSASAAASLANKSAKFRFRGISAHAAAAPDQGRSALDAVEAMNMMVNMMREHIPDGSRIHYVITDGGKAPNVVPNFAEVYYYARDKDRQVVMNIFDRIVKAAEGAALGTETQMDYEIIGGTHELLPNLTLQRMVHEKLVQVGGYSYSESEKEFAESIFKTLEKPLPISTAEKIVPFKEVGTPGGSTDVGDVSFAVPTVGMRIATWAPGTPSHSWQAVAAGKTSIAHKGMMVAAKTITLSAIELFEKPKLIEQAKVEFIQRRGKNFTYTPLIGDRTPALDYRN